ncbi:MAG: hypothetical protein AAGA29_08460 [Planctomycetota bacterium]
MNTTTKRAALLALAISLCPMVGCEGESPTAAIPKTEGRLNDYALTQIYEVALLAGEPLNASSLKSQIDPLISQYGEAQVIDKIKEIASNDDAPATRAAAVFSIQPYVDADTYNDMVDALDEEAQASFQRFTR